MRVYLTRAEAEAIERGELPEPLRSKVKERLAKARADEVIPGQTSLVERWDQGIETGWPPHAPAP